MGTFAGISNCSFAHLAVYRAASGVGNQYNTGTTQATDGQTVATLVDISGSGNNAPLVVGSTAAVLRVFGNDIDGAEAKMEFNNSGYTLPAGVTMGGGSPTGEGTMFFFGRPAAYGNSGFPMAVGDCSFPYQVLNTSPNLVQNQGGGLTTFPQNEVIGPMAPNVYACRYKAGVEMKFYVGTNHRIAFTPAGNIPSVTKTGGFVGSFGTGNYWIGDYRGCAVFSQALTDAQVVQVLQFAQDMMNPGYTNAAQVMFFGDSRTAGYDATETTSYPIQRSWPWRVTRMLGGRIRPWNVAVGGQTIALQTAGIINQVPCFSADYPIRIAMGEVGINDIRTGRTLSQIQADYVALVAALNSGTVNPTHIIFMTIVVDGNATSPQSTLRQQVNAWLMGDGLGPTVTIVDNAVDTRLGTTQYVESDLLHQSDAGQGVYAANAVGAILLPLLGITPRKTNPMNPVLKNIDGTFDSGAVPVTTSTSMQPVARLAVKGGDAEISVIIGGQSIGHLQLSQGAYPDDPNPIVIASDTGFNTSTAANLAYVLPANLTFPIPAGTVIQMSLRGEASEYTLSASTAGGAGATIQTKGTIFDRRRV